MEGERQLDSLAVGSSFKYEEAILIIEQHQRVIGGQPGGKEQVKDKEH